MPSTRNLWLALALPLAAASAAAQTAKPGMVIDFVHMGGNDCPPCVAWRRTELPKLQAAPEFQAIRFTHVTKTVKSAVPPALFFPQEVKHLQPALAEASNGISGSPQQAILVNGKVVDYWFGAGRGSAEQIAAMVRAIHGGELLPRPTCQLLKTSSKCQTPGPSKVS